MTTTPRDIRVLAGAHTPQTDILVDLLRARRDELLAEGTALCLPRMVPNLLEPALAEPGPAAREAFIGALAGDGATRVAVIHRALLGTWSRMIGERVLYPDAETGLASIARLFPDDRLTLILSVVPLTSIFAAARGDLAKAVRRTRWETLYELSWADRVEMALDLLPEARIVVVTPEGAALAGERVAERTFGHVLNDDDAFLQAALSDAGREALAQTRAVGVEPDTVDLLARHAAVPDPDGLARQGIDPSLTQLLDDRFEEDIARLRLLRRVTLV